MKAETASRKTLRWLPGRTVLGTSTPCGTAAERGFLHRTRATNIRKSILVAALCALCAMAAASVPDGQTAVDKAIVRLTGLTQDRKGSQGTGTVIDKGMFDANTLGLCLLTCDHVTAKWNTPFKFIGFGDLKDPDTFNLPDNGLLPSALSITNIYGRNDFNKADISLITVKIDLKRRKEDGGLSDAQKTYLKGIVPYKLVEAPAQPKFDISSFGFGGSGALLGNGKGYVGFDKDYPYGKLRWYNNKIDAYQDVKNDTYDYKAMGYLLNKKGDADFIDGEGAGLGGDSGSALFQDKGIVGVFTFADSTILFDGKQQRIGESIEFGARCGGVRMTKDLKGLIEKNCTVPEPSAMLALVSGIAALIGRRRSIKR